MKELTITKNEAGQRLDKFLLKYLNQAPSGLIHKFLRKKDIRLNGSRAQGNEKLTEGDIVQIRLSDVSIENLKACKVRQTTFEHIHVLYEDDDVLILNKPAGILSQQSRSTDVSLNEEMLSYLMERGEVTAQSLSFFKPSVCNRLDRNTAGIVLAAKNLPAAQELNALLRSRLLRKEYQCIVSGSHITEQVKEGYLLKNEKTNKMQIFAQPAAGCTKIITGIRPISSAGGFSRLRIELITGKSHQIRAQLSAMGHPIAGDVKYGGAVIKGLHHQALCADCVIFPADLKHLRQLSGQTFHAPLPDDFRQTAQMLGLSFTEDLNSF